MTDEVLRDLLEDVIKQKKRNFVLAAKGGKCKALMLKKRAVTESDGNTLRKLVSGSAIHTGVCQPGDDANIAFMFHDVEQVPVETKPIQKFIKEATGLNKSVECNILTGEPTIDVADELDMQLELIAELLETLRESRPEQAEAICKKLAELRIRAEETAGDEDAIAGLMNTVLHFRMELGKSVGVKQQTDHALRSEMTSKLSRIEEIVAELSRVEPETGKALKDRFRDLQARADALDKSPDVLGALHTEAGKLLTDSTAANNLAQERQETRRDLKREWTLLSEVVADFAREDPDRGKVAADRARALKTEIDKLDRYASPDSVASKTESVLAMRMALQRSRSASTAADPRKAVRVQITKQWNGVAQLVSQVVAANPDKGAKITALVKKTRTDSDALTKRPAADETDLRSMLNRVTELHKSLANALPETSKSVPADGQTRLTTMVFDGDDGKASVFARTLGGEKELHAAIAEIAAAKKKIYDDRYASDPEEADKNVRVTPRTIYMALENKFLAKRKIEVSQREAAIEAGAASRRMQATVAGIARCEAAGAQHVKVRELAARVEDVRAEVKVRGLDRDDVTVEALALAPDRTQGDEAFKREKAGMKSLREELLAQEPIMLVAARIQGLKADLADIEKRLSKVQFIGYGDSRSMLKILRTEIESLETDLASKFKSADKMSIAEQNMVASAADLDAVAARLAATECVQDANQAWALVAAERKGAETQELNRIRALEKLNEYNGRWGTSYDEVDLDRILAGIAGGKMGTNFTFSKEPGANREKAGKGDGVPLSDKLIADPKFRNLWEIGTSQASDNTGIRGGVEEQMGYAAALNRTAGKEQTIGEAGPSGSKFEPAESDKGVMPKYAGAMGDLRAEEGGAPRYGNSFIVWKQDAVMARTTFAAGDSWSGTDQGAGSFSGSGHPEEIFAKADEEFVRALAASATGKDQKWLAERGEGLAKSDAYIEAQIHGDLGWEHVEEVIVREGDGGVTAEKFRKLAVDGQFDFRVRET